MGERHERRNGTAFCFTCGQQWPCDATKNLSEVERLQAELARLTGERDAALEQAARDDRFARDCMEITELANQDALEDNRLLHESEARRRAGARRAWGYRQQRDAARAALARLVDHYQPSHYHGGKRPDETCLWCAARAALEATP